MKKFERIVLIAYEAYGKKIQEDFYVNSICKSFDFEYWNLSAIYEHSTVHSIVGEKIIKDFSSLKKVEEEIIKYKDSTLFIFNINYYANVYTLFRLFSKYKCQTAFFARGALPFPLLSEPLIKKIFLKSKSLTDPRNLTKIVLNQLAAAARRIQLIKPFTYIFFAGKQGVSTIGYGREYGLNKSKLIPVNSSDFDKSLLLKNKTGRELNERYCVFLDAFLPYHPDFDLLKMKKVDATSYYNSLNNFFDYVEASCNIKVVVAAHPRSNYEESDAYKGRTILKFKTAELIKGSEFVLAHASTSISFAVVFKKPVVFIYNNDIKETYPYTMYPLVLHFAEVLKSICINIDENTRLNFKVSNVDENSYNNYKYNYLTNKESENLLTEKVFIDFLKSLK